MASDRSASPQGQNGQNDVQQNQQWGDQEAREASPMAQELLGTEASIFPLPPKSLYAPFADYSEETKDKAEFQPPRVDWIHEDGHWQVFGQTWPIEDHLPSLQEIGVEPIHDTQADRRDALHMLLRTLVQTHFTLLDTLTKPPPSIHRPVDQPNDLDKILNHLRITTFSMHHLVNQLRPIQAKENLIKIVREEIQDTRDRTSQLNEKVDQVRAALQKLSKYHNKAAEEAAATASTGDRVVDDNENNTTAMNVVSDDGNDEAEIKKASATDKIMASVDSIQ